MKGAQTPKGAWRRRIWIPAFIALALLCVGLGAVLAAKIVSSHMHLSQVEAAAAEAPQRHLIDQPLAGPQAGGNAPLGPAQRPRFVPPAASAASQLASAEPAAMGREPTSPRSPVPAAGPGPVRRGKETASAVQAPAVGAQTVATVEEPPVDRPADVAVSGIQADAPAAPERSQSNVRFVPAPMSDEQVRAEKARRAVRERSRRIAKVVQQLETALSRPTGNDDRIERLLTDLAQLKGEDNTYVKKMRAFWLLKKGRYDQARALLAQMRISNAPDPEIDINLAVIDLHQGERQKALERLRRLRKSHPDNVRVAELLRKLN